jgi:hypothetical protein
MAMTVGPVLSCLVCLQCHCMLWCMLHIHATGKALMTSLPFI